MNAVRLEQSKPKPNSLSPASACEGALIHGTFPAGVGSARHRAEHYANSTTAIACIHTALFDLCHRRLAEFSGTQQAIPARNPFEAGHGSAAAAHAARGRVRTSYARRFGNKAGVRLLQRAYPNASGFARVPETYFICDIALAHRRRRGAVRSFTSNPDFLGTGNHTSDASFSHPLISD